MCVLYVVLLYDISVGNSVEEYIKKELKEQSRMKVCVPKQT